MSEPRVESYRRKAFLILLIVFLGGERSRESTEDA